MQEVERQLVELAQVVGAVRSVVLRVFRLQEVVLGGHESVGTYTHHVALSHLFNAQMATKKNRKKGGGGGRLFS